MTLTKGIKTAKLLCLFPGVFLIVSGLMILFSPNGAGILFDITDIEQLQTPFALAMGIRQLAIGLMITILALSAEVKALGIVMLIGSIVPLTDFIVFSSSIGYVSALRHAAPVPIILGLGVYLLYQTRNPMLTRH